MKLKQNRNKILLKNLFKISLFFLFMEFKQKWLQNRKLSELTLISTPIPTPKFFFQRTRFRLRLRKFADCWLRLRLRRSRNRVSESSAGPYRLVVSGGAERRRRTTRRSFRRVLEYVAVRIIPGNTGCIPVEIYANIPLIKNIPQHQFWEHILNWESLHKLHIWNPNGNSF